MEFMGLDLEQCYIYSFKRGRKKWGECNVLREMRFFRDEEYENIYLGKWSQVMKKDNGSTNGLFLCNNFLLQVQRGIQ